MENILQIATLISVLAGIVVIPWYLRGMFARMDERFARVDNTLKSIGEALSTQMEVLSITIGSLARQDVLSKEDLSRIGKELLKDHIGNIRRITSNPISPEELSRLNSYISKIEQGIILEVTELQDYNTIVHTLREEKGSVDPGMVALIAIGALFAGLLLGGKK